MCGCSCLLCRFLRKLCCYQFVVRNAFVKFAGFLQDVFQKLEAVLLEDGVVLPGILIFVAADNGGDGILIGLLELGLDHFGDFFGGVGVDVFQAFLNRVGEFLDGVGILSQIAFFDAVGGLGDISGIDAEGGDDMAVSFFFQTCGKRFKLDCIILNPALISIT